jgi:anaerobic selenocysteine-containing dehydrogenase
MGITQYCTGTANVHQIVNLLLLKGNIGKQGAGICPLRGHSNAQGNRTVGIMERPTKEFLERLGSVILNRRVSTAIRSSRASSRCGMEEDEEIGFLRRRASAIRHCGSKSLARSVAAFNSNSPADWRVAQSIDDSCINLKSN